MYPDGYKITLFLCYNYYVMEMKTIIERLDHMGNGIAYIDGIVTFIPKCVPGDEVEIEIIKSKKNFKEGKVLNFISKSENHVDSFCPYYDICGGCHLQNLSYEATKEYKINRLKNILNRVGIDNDVTFVENDYPKNYRNKIELKVKNGKLGFYKSGSHEIVEIDTCNITKNAINNFIPEIKEMNIINGDVIIRCNFNDELLIDIKTNDDIKLCYDYSKYKVVGIIINDKVVYGEGKYLDKINDLFFEVSYDSFFQVNSNINSKLFKLIEKHAKGDIVLDLYSGVGTLSLMASKTANKVYAIETIPNAVINAIRNAKINNINNVNFILGNVEDKIKYINDNIDTVIVDPPRKGLDDFTISKLFELNPNKIIYISCETQKLSEDLKKLLNNYKVSYLYALDMFSYTYHVESVCVLERKN